MKKLILFTLGTALLSAHAADRLVTNLDELKSAAESAAAGDTILVSAAGSPYLLDGPLTITKQNVTVRGVKADGLTPAGTGEVVLDGQGLYRILNMTGKGACVQSLKFINGYLNNSSYHGAGLAFNLSPTTVSNCVFSCCTNAAAGGGAVTFRGTEPVVVYDSHFDHNAATTGGAVWNNNKSSPPTSYYNCTFRTNATTAASTAHGAAISSTLGVVSNCFFYGNVTPPKTSNLAGCIFGGGENPTIVDCVFDGNRAGSASVAYLTGTNYEIVHCTFRDNVADVDNVSKSGVLGGVIYAGSGIRRLVDCDFLTNAVVNTQLSGDGQNSGGVLYGAVEEMSGCKFIGNRGAGRGGAWYIRSGYATYEKGLVRDTLFEDNRMTCERTDNYSGGAVYQFTDPIFMTFSNCQFVANADYTVPKNKAIGIGGGGGAVYAQPFSRFEDCLFKNNETLNRGSAITGAVTGGVVRCTFTGNLAHHPAAGVVDNRDGVTSTSYMACGTVYLTTVPKDGWCTVEDSVFTNNTVFGMSGSAFYQEVGSLRMTGCTIVDNLLTNSQEATVASFYGGAVYLCNNTKNVTDRTTKAEIDRCVFRRNRGFGTSAESNGYIRGALQFFSRYTQGMSSNTFDGWVRNSLFVGNVSKDLNATAVPSRNQGGAFYASNHPIAVENCTFADNSSDGAANGNAFAAGANVTFVNNVFAGGQASGGTQSNNLTDEDPGFTDAAAGDYTLLKASKAREAGMSLAWHATAFDLAGNPRVTGDAVDIGCYEYRGRSDLVLLFR